MHKRVQSLFELSEYQPCCECGFQSIRVSPAIYRRRGKYRLHPLYWFHQQEPTDIRYQVFVTTIPCLLYPVSWHLEAIWTKLALFWNQGPELPPNACEGTGRLCPLGCILQSEMSLALLCQLQLYWSSSHHPSCDHGTSHWDHVTGCPHEFNRNSALMRVFNQGDCGCGDGEWLQKC